MATPWREPSSAIDRPAPHDEIAPAPRERLPALADPARGLTRDTTDAAMDSFTALDHAGFDAFPDPVICTDASGTVAGWNRAAETMFGFTAREALGTRPPIVPAEDEERADAFLARVLRGETVPAAEVERCTKAGARLTLLLSAAPWRVGREIAGALTTYMDLAAQKSREQNLTRQIASAQQQARDAAYLVTVADACIAPTDTTTLLQALAECTAAWADSAGVIYHMEGRSELVAYAARSLDDDGSIAALFHACAIGYPGSEPAAAMPRVHYLREIPLTGASRAQGYHTLAAVPIRADDAVIATLVTAARGATAPLDEGALVTLDRAATQIGNAIARREAEHALLTRAEALEAEARRRDDFLATVSHELRTPLTAILGFAHIIVENDGLGAERRRGMAEDIVASGGLLLTQVNDLLDIVQLGAGRLTVPTEVIDLTAVVRWCERAVRSLMSSKQLRFEIAIPADLPPVRANTARLQQVLLNFLVNAYKFTPAGGTVRLCARVTRETVAITVRDTGIGIAPEHATRIFEPFARVETEYTRTQSGAGVGLAVARQLVDLMDGTITLDSTPDVGSAFTVALKTACEE